MTTTLRSMDGFVYTGPLLSLPLRPKPPCVYMCGCLGNWVYDGGGGVSISLSQTDSENYRGVFEMRKKEQKQTEHRSLRRNPGKKILHPTTTSINGHTSGSSDKADLFGALGV